MSFTRRSLAQSNACCVPRSSDSSRSRPAERSAADTVASADKKDLEVGRQDDVPRHIVGGVPGSVGQGAPPAPPQLEPSNTNIPTTETARTAEPPPPPPKPPGPPPKTS